MKFRDFAECLLGSKVKVKLIRYLLSRGAITSEREIASLIGVSHNAVNKILKEFYELNLISPLRVGTATVWNINKDSYAFQVVSKLGGIVTPLEDLESKIIKQYDLVKPIKRVVIFGSLVEGEELPNSDIDLFVLITDSNQKRYTLSSLADLNSVCLQKYGNKLSPIVMTEKEYAKFKNKKLLEKIKKGIVVIER